MISVKRDPVIVSKSSWLIKEDADSTRPNDIEVISPSGNFINITLPFYDSDICVAKTHVCALINVLQRVEEETTE